MDAKSELLRNPGTSFPMGYENSHPPSFLCPICHETIISLAQLNRHIDDIHDPNIDVDDSETNILFKSKENLVFATENSPHERSLKLDLHEDSSHFSLSEHGGKFDNSDSSRLKRTHWQHVLPNRNNICSEPNCKTVLNARNGVVNCRKCGHLFCNEHTRFSARLSNSSQDGQLKSPLIIYDSVHGTLVKVCGKCYMDKPGIKCDPQTKAVDLTELFLAKRQKFIEEKLLARSRVHTKFIKLTDLHSKKHLWHVQNGNSLSLVWDNFRRGKASKYSKASILDAEKDIVGIENWESDEYATHCKLCFVKFNLLTRKHHCRLCGLIVNDGSYNLDDPAQFCSAQVPMNLLLAKLPSLNYSPLVQNNWEQLMGANTDSDFSIRVCKTCKNLLLHSTPANIKTVSENDAEVLDAYDQILAIKATIVYSMARYEALVSDKKEAENHQTNKLRVRLHKAVKDLEVLVNSFFNRFFVIDPFLRKLIPLHSDKLVTNIYKASTAYLQESILQLKHLNEKFQNSEHQKLAGQLSGTAGNDGTPPSNSLVSATVLPSTTPRLTKKKIRELREQLMVTNEQKFIIESLIEDLKRQRKFDELVTLDENRKELGNKIEELTQELGEYGF